MRLLLDTCIIVYMIDEQDRLSRDILALLDDCENQLYVSLETIKELIVAYRRKGLFAKRWKSASDIITCIKDDLCIDVLPLHEEHMATYAQLTINEAQGHYDPSDHLIISHAITEHLTLISSDHKFDFYKSQGLDFIRNQ